MTKRYRNNLIAHLIEEMLEAGFTSKEVSQLVHDIKSSRRQGKIKISVSAVPYEGLTGQIPGPFVDPTGPNAKK